MNEDRRVSKYDRRRGNLEGVALFTRPSTIKNVQNITGDSETYTIETGRMDDGDYIFIECTDSENGLIRLALPPKVANLIASQRDSLTARKRRATAKRLAKERMDRGEVPGFMRKKCE